MKKTIPLALALLLAGALGPRSSQACSCFATYFDETLYGMNFDYPEVELKLTLYSRDDGMKVFQMQFLNEHGYVPTVGMNSEGLFASLQMLYPVEKPDADRDPDEIYTWQLYRHALNNFANLTELSEYLDGKRAIQGNISLHNFFADAGGEAMVVEVGKKDNVITRMDGAYMVMTNFPIHEIGDRNPDEVSGVGADRYQTACGYIDEHRRSFDLDRALETLRQAVSGGQWATRCSMVFDPKSKTVFLAVNQDFEHIWKLSIESGTIETHSGFDEYQRLPLDENGVDGSVLTELATAGDPR